MISAYDGQLTDLLSTYYANDTEVQALSYAIREGTRLVYQYMSNALIYASIETVPEKALDLMAVELRTQYYSENLTIEEKRALIRNTIVWYMIAGTPKAVEDLAAIVFGEGEVREWFEYDGQPFHFEIITNAYADPQNIEKFNELLQNVKNLRSYLDAVAIHRTIDTGGSHSAAVVSVTVKPKAIRCKL